MRSDALIVVVSVPSGVRVLSAHGLAESRDWLDPDSAAKVRRALEDRTAIGGTCAPVALAGGRNATSMVVVPIPDPREPRALVALRVHPPFTPQDAGPMSKAAELFALQPVRTRHFPWPFVVTGLAIGCGAILIAALAFAVPTYSGLVLAGPLVGVAGATVRGGRIALRLALALGALTIVDRASAPFLYGDRGDVAFGLEFGGALAALALVIAALAALRQPRYSA